MRPFSLMIHPLWRPPKILVVPNCLGTVPQKRKGGSSVLRTSIYSLKNRGNPVGGARNPIRVHRSRGCVANRCRPLEKQFGGLRTTFIKEGRSAPPPGCELCLENVKGLVCWVHRVKTCWKKFWCLNLKPKKTGVRKTFVGCSPPKCGLPQKTFFWGGTLLKPKLCPCSLSVEPKANLGRQRMKLCSSERPPFWPKVKEFLKGFSKT